MENRLTVLLSINFIIIHHTLSLHTRNTLYIISILMATFLSLKEATFKILPSEEKNSIFRFSSSAGTKI